MRAAARFKEGRNLLQVPVQHTAEALLAERLISSSLAGPSNATSITQLAQRAHNTQPGSAIAGLARLYSSVSRAGIAGSPSVGPKQQVSTRSFSTAFACRLPVFMVKAVLLMCIVFCRQMQRFKDLCGGTLAVNLLARVRLHLDVGHLSHCHKCAYSSHALLTNAAW